MAGKTLCKQDKGFTLAELLIALAILGVIATFTIPKVLQSQQDGKYKAMGKEAAGLITGSVDALKLNGGFTTATKPADLTPYINYVRYDTSSLVSDTPTRPDVNCSSSKPCLVLHNGAFLQLGDNSFGGSGTTNALWFQLDPDGSGSVDAVEFNLYYGGRLTTWGTCLSGTTDSGGSSWGPDPTKDPDWFGWD